MYIVHFNACMSHKYYDLLHADEPMLEFLPHQKCAHLLYDLGNS